MTKEKRLKEEFELEELIHKNRIEEIELEFECRKKAEAIKFDYMMSHVRLKNANIERSQMRKNYGNKTF